MPTCTFRVSSEYRLIVPVNIANPDTGQELTVDAEIDTGATRTQIEDKIAEELELPFQETELIDSINSTIRCNSYSANIAFQFEGDILVNLGEYSIIDGLNTTVQCIIARDILYSGLLIYNGINNYFSLSFDPITE